MHKKRKKPKPACHSQCSIMFSWQSDGFVLPVLLFWVYNCPTVQDPIIMDKTAFSDSKDDHKLYLNSFRTDQTGSHCISSKKETSNKLVVKHILTKIHLYRQILCLWHLRWQCVHLYRYTLNMLKMLVMEPLLEPQQNV